MNFEVTAWDASNVLSKIISVTSDICQFINSRIVSMYQRISNILFAGCGVETGRFTSVNLADEYSDSEAQFCFLIVEFDNGHRRAPTTAVRSREWRV